MFADALRSTLGALDDFVLEIAERGSEATVILERETFDVVLVDIGLPDQSGLTLGRSIAEAYPDTSVIALTAISDWRLAQEAMEAGFNGYLTKDTELHKLIDAIRVATEGHAVVPTHLAREAGASRRSPARMLADQLTDRELEILAMLVRGYGSGEMSRQLGISMNTVRSHIQNILPKLQVHSRLEAAAFAVRHGLVTADRADGWGAVGAPPSA